MIALFANLFGKRPDILDVECELHNGEPKRMGFPRCTHTTANSVDPPNAITVEVDSFCVLRE